MDNQVTVGVRNRTQYLEEEPHPRFDIEDMAICITIDMLTLDVFEHEIRLASEGDAGIEQLRYVGMSEAGEDISLTLEPLLSALTDKRNIEKFHGDFALKSAIVSLCQPDAAHSALTSLRYQRISTESLAGQTP